MQQDYMTTIGSKNHSGTRTKKISKEEMEKMRQEDNRMVRGIFRSHEPRGGSVSFSWRKYKGDPIRHFHLQDGVEYQIPLGAAKHLNQDCNRHEHSHILGPDGLPSVNKEGKKISRMNFESVEFYG